LRPAVSKRSVFWSESALDDLDKSIAYIAKRNPSAARKVHSGIEQSGNQLGSAATGRRGRVNGTYEKSVPRLPYILAYAVDPLPDGGERIVILHVIHTARDWPEGQWPK
jgi:plasmid stabilization system protein ParE